MFLPQKIYCPLSWLSLPLRLPTHFFLIFAFPFLGLLSLQELGGNTPMITHKDQTTGGLFFGVCGWHLRLGLQHAPMLDESQVAVVSASLQSGAANT